MNKLYTIKIAKQISPAFTLCIDNGYEIKGVKKDHNHCSVKACLEKVSDQLNGNLNNFSNILENK